jgi:hypothetical protein
MGYFFDLEDFETTCRAMGDAFLKSANEDNLANKAKYYQQYGNFDGYKPSQETIVLNNDGSIDFFIANRGTQKSPIEYGGYCCKYRLPFIMERAKTLIGVFEGVDTTAIYWDANKQSCRWKQEPETCVLDSFKVVLNAVGDDGALFNVGNGDKDCSLEVDFDYLFKMDCQNLADILNPTITTNGDPKLASEILAIKNAIATAQVNCSQITSQIDIKSKEFLSTSYSIVSCPPTVPFAYGSKAAALYAKSNLIYCISEENGGLTQWQNILGPARYKRFLDGDVNSYTCEDVTALLAINNQLNSKNQPLILNECTTPFGYKSKLKLEIDTLVVNQKTCQANIAVLEAELNTLNTKTDVTTSCSTPTAALETLDVSVMLDVINSDGSLTTIYDSELFAAIGTDNLYDYLTQHPYDSGFYICGSDSLTGCTALNYGDELTGPTVPFGFDLEDYATTYRNVEPCNIVKNSLLTDLKKQSGLSETTADIQTFKASLSNSIFASKWLKYTLTIDDVNILTQIANKKIKLSLKINNTCSNVCIYIDNIKLNRTCIDGNGQSVLISESPGFHLERIIDNKKSWLKNTTRVNRDFDISNNVGQNMIRKTDYDVNDERLVINTKEIDLDINIASAIENDVQCYINDNLGLLDSVPSTECGCEYECYKDVFKIITHAEAIAISPSVPKDSEDILTTTRAVRDAWVKAWNEVMLATAPYLDIVNGVYHPNPSPDVMLVYTATRDAYNKALREFNLASGAGIIDYITVDGHLYGDQRSDHEYITYSKDGKVAPQIFNTKCGRIMTFAGTWAGEDSDGRFYIVETPENEVKLYLTNSHPSLEKTWIDISNLVQEDYPSSWSQCTVPDKATEFCKRILPQNYTSLYNMVSFKYQNNNNAAHNKWFSSADNSFFIGWDTAKKKCVTKKFKQSIPEEFSMLYPITSKVMQSLVNRWFPCSPQCLVDFYVRNYNTTACDSCSTPIPNWSFPESGEDLSGMNRQYRDFQYKLLNETISSELEARYYAYVLDPNTGMPPDESGGYIPVHVTTTIRKGSRDGDIAFKEEYILNDITASCSRLPHSDSSFSGLEQLHILVGITDPNTRMTNHNTCAFGTSCGPTDNGTYITGSTSTLPLNGASTNGADADWLFDEDYYVHFDVVNNNTGEVYHVTNNDVNLISRTLPIKCPNSASTQTFDINMALNSINTFKTTILGEIQEDLDSALFNCNCDIPQYTDAMSLDFMDDLRSMPSFDNLNTLPYSSTTIDFSSYNSLLNPAYYNSWPKYSEYQNKRSDIFLAENYVIDKMVLGFPKQTLNSTYLDELKYIYFDNSNFKPQLINNFEKKPIKKIKNLWWRKANTYQEWTGSTYTAHTQTLDNMFPNVDDFKYLTAVGTLIELPISGNSGDLIVVGNPSSYNGYAWDPILNSWESNLYNFINSEILTQRESFKTAKILAKKEIMLAIKPFVWANDYLVSHGIKQWLYGDAKNFNASNRTGADVIYNYNNSLPLGLPPTYVMTAATYSIPSYSGSSDYIVH